MPTMKSKKRSVSQLLFLACVYAEQDRRGMAGADQGEAGAKALQLARELHAYRVKRWGRTAFEAMMDNTKSVDVKDIFKWLK